MQQLSQHLAAELGALRPMTLVRWRAGQWGLPLFLVWSALRLGWGLLRGRVGAVLIGDPVLSVLAVAARCAKVPAAVVVHGLDVTYPNPLYQRYLRWFFADRFEVYFCISRFVRAELIARGIPASHCVLVHPGVTAPAMLPETVRQDAP
ncbi:MAG: glycosyltransferase, partial [Lysobacter sp.]